MPPVVIGAGCLLLGGAVFPLAGAVRVVPEGSDLCSHVPAESLASLFTALRRCLESADIIGGLREEA